MKNNKYYQYLEYLSMILILSYFNIHNIFLVLTGIVLSVCLINIKFINNLIRSINKEVVMEKATKDINKNVNEIKHDSNNTNLSKEDSDLTLVERIEELGFIPSIDKHDDTKTA